MDTSGRSAVPERTLDVVQGGGEDAIGMPSAGALCGNQLYLTDMRNGRIHGVSLTDGRRLSRYGDNKAARLKGPEAIAVDCDAGSLFVLDFKTLLEFDLTSSGLRSRREFVTGIGPAIGTAVFVKDSVYIPGHFLGGAGDWQKRSADRALEGARVSYEVPVRGERSGGPRFQAMNPGCRAMSPDICNRVGLDYDPTDDTWLACEAGGSVVTIYNGDGTVRRIINIASPLFISDGRVLDSAAAIPERIRWIQTNSTVYSCGFFGAYIATTHVIYEPGEWSPGKSMVPRVYLTLHGRDGTPLVADLRLPDRPMAKDARSIYTVSRGGLHGTDDAAGMVIDQFRIITEDGMLAPELARH